VSVSSISWAIQKSAPRPKQITHARTPSLSFYKLATQPTASRYWRQLTTGLFKYNPTSISKQPITYYSQTSGTEDAMHLLSEV